MSFEINPEFVENELVRDFLIDWIEARGSVRKGVADRLETVIKALPSEHVTTFVKLVENIYVSFHEEKARERVKNLRDNSTEAQKARVEAYMREHGPVAVEAVLAESEKAKKEFLDRNYRT